MEQPIISSRLLFISLALGSIVLLLTTIGNIFSSATKIAVCNIDSSLTVYIRLNNKHDLLVNPKSLKSTLSCVGKYMPFYDRTIEFLLINPEKKTILAELKDRYDIINIISSTNVNFKTIGKIRYDNKYIEYQYGSKNYLIVSKEISPFDLQKKLRSKNYSLVFTPSSTQNQANLARIIKNEKIEVPLNKNYVYLVSSDL